MPTGMFGSAGANLGPGVFNQDERWADAGKDAHGGTPFLMPAEMRQPMEALGTIARQQDRDIEARRMQSLGILAGSRRQIQQSALGMGDIKLMAMVGAFLGWEGALGTILCGSFVGSIVGVALMIRGRGGRQTALPFGTFLAPAAWIVLFASKFIWEGYLRLLPVG